MNVSTKYWITVASVLVISYLTALIIRRLLGRAIRRRSEILKEDPTNFVFLKNSVWFIIITATLIVIFIITPQMKEIGKTLFVSAGILAATIGFASQKAFSNILSGIFILIFKPFSVNDTIEIRSENMKGVVEELTLRHTVIKDYENRRIIIPNSLISEKTLVNSSTVNPQIRKHIDISISYDSDIDKAKQIIEEVVTAHPNCIFDSEQEGDKIVKRVTALTDFAVNIRAYVWSEDNDSAFVLHCDTLEKVKKRFAAEGIEIPFPYRTVVFKNPEELK